MKARILLLSPASFLAILFVSFTFAQVNDAKFKKVEIGMSVDEVKKILGRPKAVETGFPQSWDGSDPDMAGQLNYTSWFYPCEQSKKETYTELRLNNRKVSPEVFEAFAKSDTLVFDGDSLWNPDDLPECFVDGDTANQGFYHNSSECFLLLGQPPMTISWAEVKTKLVHGGKEYLRPCLQCARVYTFEKQEKEFSGHFRIDYALSKVFVVVFERGTNLVTNKAEHEFISDAQETRLK